MQHLAPWSIDHASHGLPLLHPSNLGPRHQNTTDLLDDRGEDGIGNLVGDVNRESQRNEVRKVAARRRRGHIRQLSINPMTSQSLHDLAIVIKTFVPLRMRGTNKNLELGFHPRTTANRTAL